jgi:hypothetical protein
MCMFSRPVKLVAKTKIFARELEGSRQALVYAMDVDIDEELAMVLPLPVPPSPPEDAVEFVDLSGYPDLFARLEAAFPPAYALQPLSRGFGPPPQKATLRVHDVGSFEASFVPRRADLDRLDPRFRLPESVWRSLARYDDWGFAVFRLKPQKGLLGRTQTQSVHPMAFVFPQRRPRALFFPTVHAHDGSVPAIASFDHALYCQPSALVARNLGWDASLDALGKYVDVARTRGLLDEAAGHRGLLMGQLPNKDVWLDEPEGVTLADFDGRGECFAFSLRGMRAYDFGPTDERFARWRVTARTKLGALSRGLRAALARLETEKREAWCLGPLHDGLRPHFLNGFQLWAGSSWQDGRHEHVPGPARVDFGPFSDHVEPQSVTLGFTELPSQELVDQIRAELVAALERAVRS